ncbi:Putative Zn-dependent protease, contains TPR repeats [Moraxella caviae]|nr:Putative Zn-dependent protease, contains TPR repeats [Moraxella caviae]VEW12617.1 Putative Zn-dependent protease, contains TPR repeats [Moraxella caviae]
MMTQIAQPNPAQNPFLPSQFTAPKRLPAIIKRAVGVGLSVGVLVNAASANVGLNEPQASNALNLPSGNLLNDAPNNSPNDAPISTAMMAQNPAKSSSTVRDFAKNSLNNQSLNLNSSQAQNYGNFGDAARLDGGFSLPSVRFSANAHAQNLQNSANLGVSAANPSAVNFTTPNLSAGANFQEQRRNKEIAAWSLRQINASLPLIDDPWAVQQLVQMGAQMNALVRGQSLLSVVLINDSNINAFAVPGGLIGMNAGTILSADALDEVASVMAHEIAHLSQRHYEHNLDNRKKFLAIGLGGLLAAIAASAASGDAAAAMMIGAQTMGAESMAAHSREHEREADRVGQQILAQAGFDAKAMPRFFQQLQRQVSLNRTANAFAPSFMRSHPFTTERLSESTQRAANFTAPTMTQKQAQAQAFDALYWRLNYLSKQANETELRVNAKHSKGAQLALAMYLADNQRHQEAQSVYQAGQFDSDDVLACITAAHLAAAKQDYQQAVDVLAPCQAIYPERRDLRLYLAQHAINAGDFAKALNLLSPLTFDGSHDVLAWDLSQKAYTLQANHAQNTHAQTIATIHALRARSQLLLWRGQYEGALQANAQAAMHARTDNATMLLTMLDNDKAAIVSARDFKP